MKQLNTIIAGLVSCCLFALTATAGTEMYSGKEMKQVTTPLPPPPMCDWSGFYLGINAGGQFGHSETHDLDDYWTGKGWGYRESGFAGGGQLGYNLQWNHFLIGPEFDAGYMNLDGHGEQPGTNFPGGPNFGATSSDFFTTLRGRVGVSLDWYGCWLVYGTGGAIGVNYETKDYDPNENFFGSRTDFKWGYTVGGGIERKIAGRWSVKVEYLYFDLGTQGFIGSSPTFANGAPFRFEGDTTGHMLRAGLNFHF